MDLLAVAESLESSEDRNENPAPLYVSDERYDEDSDLDNVGSQVSAEQELHRPPLGVPPKHDSMSFEDFIFNEAPRPFEASRPFEDLNFTQPPSQNFGQHLAPSLQLYTKTLG